MNISFPPKPSVLPVDKVILQEPEYFILDNGIPVYLINAGTEDVMRIDFTFDAGQTQEHKALLSSTTNMMLTEGSRGYTSNQMKESLDFLGAFYNLYAEKDRAGLILYFANRHLNKILELASEILSHPLFPEDELKTLMQKRLNQYLVNREKVNHIAMEQFFESIFGSHHPYGRKIIPEDFSTMTSTMIKEFHSAFYVPGKMAIIVSGKIEKDIISLINRYFGISKGEKIFTQKSSNHPVASDNKKIHFSRKEAVQTAVRIGCPVINRCHPDYPGLKILNVILGGYFNSRLMKNIREDKGYTYGIYSNVSSLVQSGFSIISAEVNKRNTQKAIDEIYREILKLQNEPVEEEEMAIVRSFMSGELVRMFDGPFAMAESFRAVWDFGLDHSYFEKLMQKIRTISTDEINILAKTYYNIDGLYEISAG